jgi:hypothetical protein
MPIKSRFECFTRRIKPTPEHIQEANRQTKHMIDQLHNKVSSDGTFTLEKILRAGSNAKHTSLRRTEDIRVSLSATIASEDTRAVVTGAVEIDVSVKKPDVMWLQSPDQLRVLGNKLREVLLAIRNHMPDCQRIHLFYAGPTGGAVTIGHCQDFKDRSTDRWHSPAEICTAPSSSRLDLMLGGDGEGYRLNDWSFSQMCKLAGVSKDTVNKVSADTAGRVLAETFPQGGKPMQVLTLDRVVRSIHGASYTRLHNLDLLAIVKEFGTDFQPPQTGMNGATGLYCGEQDMFVFLIDPTGWAEIQGEAFAPGFFIWNSEVGRRSVGVQTFWFQAVCQNHIVWDAVEVVDFSRKHTAKVSDSLSKIRRIIAQLVEKRDERRDGFARVMKKAFETRLGDQSDDVAKVLFKHGIAAISGNPLVRERFDVETRIRHLERLQIQFEADQCQSRDNLRRARAEAASASRQAAEIRKQAAILLPAFADLQSVKVMTADGAGDGKEQACQMLDEFIKKHLHDIAQRLKTQLAIDRQMSDSRERRISNPLPAVSINGVSVQVESQVQFRPAEGIYSERISDPEIRYSLKVPDTDLWKSTSQPGEDCSKPSAEKSPSFPTMQNIATASPKPRGDRSSN